MQVISYWGVGGTSMVILAFTLDFQGAGIWAGLVIGLSVASVVLSWRFHHLSKRAMQTIAGLPEAG
jgi:MATE family multidrug resistance protein